MVDPWVQGTTRFVFIILYFVQLEMFVFPVFCERQFVTQEQRKWIKLYVVSLILHYLYYYTWFMDLSHTTETSLYLELMSTHLRVPPSHSGCSLLSWSHPGPPPPPHLPSVDHRKTQTLGFIIFNNHTFFAQQLQHFNASTWQEIQKVSEWVILLDMSYRHY